jgi:hypothetical protein
LIDTVNNAMVLIQAKWLSPNRKSGFFMPVKAVIIGQMRRSFRNLRCTLAIPKNRGITSVFVAEASIVVYLEIT